MRVRWFILRRKVSYPYRGRLMLGVESEFGTSALRLWAAAGSAAALMTIFVLALFRWPSALPASRTLQVGVVVVPAALGAMIVWAMLSRGDLGNPGAERRAFEQRAEELSARALAPGSPLACLDGTAGENVEAACEKALFATPASVASASSYVAARLNLLANMAAYAKRGGAGIDDVMIPLQRSLETDRFGFLAHLLTIRDGCTSQSCKALVVLRDAGRVRSNLSAQTLDRYLEHYLPVWAAAPDGALAEAAQSSANTAGQSGNSGARKMVNIDFPSAASIPAVSIINPEPTGPASPGAAPANASAQAATSHRSRKQVSGVAPPSAVPPSVAQPSGSVANAAEPIWPEPVPPAPNSQPAAASANAAPIPLSPPSPAAVRTQ